MGLDTIDRGTCVSAKLRRKRCRNGIVLVTWHGDGDLVSRRGTGEGVVPPFRCRSLSLKIQASATDEKGGMGSSVGHSEDSAGKERGLNTMLKWPRVRDKRASIVLGLTIGDDAQR